MQRFDADPANWPDGDVDKDAERAATILAWLEDGQEALESIEGEGDAADGQVKVTTTAKGRVRDVAITRRAMRLDSQSLAEELLLAVRRAQDDAERKAARLVSDALGEIVPADELDLGTVQEQFGRVMQSFERH